MIGGTVQWFDQTLPFLPLSVDDYYNSLLKNTNNIATSTNTHYYKS